MTATPIAIAFIGMFAATFAYAWLAERGYYAAARFMLTIVAVAGTYCLAAGLYLGAGWVDPFTLPHTGPGIEEYHRHQRGAGLVIFAIRYWPYVLIGLGGYFTYHSVRRLWSTR